MTRNPSNLYLFLLTLFSIIDLFFSEFTSTLYIISPLSSKPLELTNGQEVIYPRRRSFSLLASSASSDWSVCYFTQPNGTVCRLLHFDYDIPGCSEISRDDGGSPTCRFKVNRPTDGNWTNSLFVFNETSGDFDVKSVRLRALVKSRLRTSTKRIKLYLDESLEVTCTAERGYPASEIGWKIGYTLLNPYPPIVECDDFSCSTQSTLNFTARRVGKMNLLCISTQKDTLGHIIKNTYDIPVTVLPISRSSSKLGAGEAVSIFFAILLFLLLVFLLCLWIYCKKRRRKKHSHAVEERCTMGGGNEAPFTIYNPPSVSSSSAYFSSVSEDVLNSPSGEPINKTNGTNLQSAEDDKLVNDDQVFEFEWEGMGPASEMGSLSDICPSSTTTTQGTDQEDNYGVYYPSLAQMNDEIYPSPIYEAMPNESWV